VLGSLALIEGGDGFEQALRIARVPQKMLGLLIGGVIFERHEHGRRFAAITRDDDRCVILDDTVEGGGKVAPKFAV
jgi:hypothetical protein